MCAFGFRGLHRVEGCGWFDVSANIAVPILRINLGAVSYLLDESPIEHRALEMHNATAMSGLPTLPSQVNTEDDTCQGLSKLWNFLNAEDTNLFALDGNRNPIPQPTSLYLLSYPGPLL
jgi:hypothetical protein